MEKYGEIPKRFTKKWWEHYWTYYKFHTLAVLFGLFMIGSIIYTNVTRITLDLGFGYVGMGSFSQEYKDAITDKVQDIIVDSAEDGRKDIRFVDYGIDMSDEDSIGMETESAFRTKLVLDIQAGEGDIFIFTGSNLPYIQEIGDCFEEAHFVAGESVDESRVFKNNEGYGFAVKLNTDNNELYSKGFDTRTGLYIAVRKIFEGNKDYDGREQLHDNSLKTARMLIGE